MALNYILVGCPCVVLTLETSEVSAILVFTTKTTQPRPQVFSVNGALNLPNLAISNWLW